MKCTIPEISWHNREPVLSLDFQLVTNDFYRLATGGGDSHILIWQISISENGGTKHEVISDLTRHQRAVNVVRWSHSGKLLASADDDANIIIWQLKTDNIPLLEGETNDKEIWNVYKIFRGHKEDIYDMCWSPDETKVLSGSIDNTAIIWNVIKGKSEQIMSDHKGFVQGVAWDPKGQYVATVSTDRICRIFTQTGKQVLARIYKGVVPLPESHALFGKEVKYFHDDTFKSFFRRLNFSPDGSLLVVPSGHVAVDEYKESFNATYIYVTESFEKPAAVLPLSKQSSTVVRFCPMYFELRGDGPESVIDLPYRMIFAVGTDHDIILYDTQQLQPFAAFHQIHYTRLTDITWSIDGMLLVASSTDGFCTFITFDPEELGVQYTKDDSDVEENANLTEPCDTVVENNKEDEESVKVPETPKPKKSNFLEKWAKRSVKTPSTEKGHGVDCSISKDTTNQTDIVEILSEDEGDASNRDEPIKKELQENLQVKSVAKPIEVRRKQRINESNVQNQTKSTETKQLKLFADAKMIAIRRKPRETVENISTPEPKPINEAKPIEIRIKPREMVKNIIETEQKQLIDAKPIEIRRKPLEPEQNINTKPKQFDKAKIIEVRRNSRETKYNVAESVGSNKPNVAKPIEVNQVSSDTTPADKTEIKNVVDSVETSLQKLDAESLEEIAESCDSVEKVPKPDQIVSNKGEEDKMLIDLTDSDIGESEEQNLATNIGVLQNKKKSEEMEVDIVQTSGELKKTSAIALKDKKSISSSSKLDSGQKGKTNSSKKNSLVANSQRASVRRKLPISCGTQAESSDEPMDGIEPIDKDKLQKPTSKRKTSVGSKTPRRKVMKKDISKPFQTKTNSLLSFLKISAKEKITEDKRPNQSVASIEIMDEDDAQDVWSWQQKKDKEKELVSSVNVSDADDCTEDFSLQIEDTNSRVCTITETKVENKTESLEMERKVPEKENSKTETVQNDISFAPSSPSVTDKRLPRRVPLITLASPKDKKKQNQS